MTRVISVRKVPLVQKSQDSLTKSRRNSFSLKDIKLPYKTKEPRESREPRKPIFKNKMVANAFIFLFVIGLVLGASAFIKSLTGKVDVSAVDYSELTPVDYSNGDTFTMNGGESIIKEFLVKNTDDTYAINTVVTFTVSEVTMETGDCKIWLRDTNGAELAEDSVVANHELMVSANYNSIAHNSQKSGKFEIQCHPDYNEELSFKLEMTATSGFTFKE